MSRCPLCGSEAIRRLGLKHTTIWGCASSGCSLQFADPQLDEPRLARAYRSHYYPEGSNGARVRYEGTPDEVLRQVFVQLEARLDSLLGLRLLDYGCGRGRLLGLSLEFGLRPTGIEPDPEARRTAAQVPSAVIYDSVEALRADKPDAQFDLIVLWNVIEHLREPWSDLQALHGLLRSGGSLLLSTMNARCLRARVQRERWENYQNPTHFYYFDRGTLQRVLFSSGFHEAREWKPKIRFPHHGLLRRCLYEVSRRVGVSDGLYYLSELKSKDSIGSVVGDP